MSSLSDALKALKNVLLLEERLAQVRGEVGGLNQDVGDLNDYVVSIDKRLIRVETMIEMSTGRRNSQPRIEQ